MSEPKSYIDLIGRQFGELTIFKKGATNTKGCARFWARCSCGDETEYLSKSLRDGIWDRCRKCKKIGSQNKEEIRSKRGLEERKIKYDISGLKVNDWTVLKPVIDKNFGCFYFCQCKCGEIQDFSRSCLLRGKVSRFCRKCLLKYNERVRTEKAEAATNSNKGVCYACSEELPIEKFDQTSLKSGVFYCIDCKKNYQENRKEKYFKINSSLDIIKCGDCRKDFEVDSFTKNQLKNKKPICRLCAPKTAPRDQKNYSEVNSNKESIKCYSCRMIAPISEFFNSSLKSKNPKCKKCVILSSRKYEKERMLVDPIYKEKKMVSNRIAKALENKGFKKDGTAATYLGIDKQGYIEHIESLFRPGMSWENRNEWQVDHVIAISQANTSEEIKRLWHYTNLQPLWTRENEQKSDHLNWREMFDWAKEVVELRKSKGLE